MNIRPIYSSQYSPDRAFMKQLKKLDKRLGCKYRVDIERFVITWDMPVGPFAELLVVRDEYGGFRHPDMRELIMLCEGDLHRTDLKERLQKTESYLREYREKEEKKIRQEIKEATIDDRIQLMQAYREAFNVGTKRSAFRRITHKPKGKTTNELYSGLAK